MAPWKLVDDDGQPFLCDATLELDRKEAIVASGDHVDRDRRPRLESAGLAEHDVGLAALQRLALSHDLGWKVVQEVGGEIEVQAVTTAVRRGCPRFLPPGVGPPLFRRLAGHGNHRVDEHDHPYPRPRAHQRRGEAAERLGDEDHLACPDRLDNAIRVDRQTRLRVVAGQVDGDGLALRLLEQRHDTMPVPRNTTGARNENEGRRPYRRYASSPLIRSAASLRLCPRLPGSVHISPGAIGHGGGHGWGARLKA